MHTLTPTILRNLAELQRAADSNSHVHFFPAGGERIINGVARHFTDVNGNFPDEDTDVRNTYLRISGTVEYFLPVSEVLSMIDAGLFTIYG